MKHGEYHKAVAARVNILNNTIPVTGVDTIPLPVTAAQGTGMQVQMFGQSAENLVVNGDFRNGTAGWSGSSSKSVVDGWLKVTATSAASKVEQFIPNIPIGSKLYVQLKSQPSDSLLFEIWEANGIQTGIVATTGGKFSVIRTTTTNTTIRLNTFQGAIGRIGYIGDVMIINLTATFGAGNEPTKEQCDLLFANYFEGTENVLGTGRIRSVNSDDMLPSSLYLTTPELRSNGLTKDEIRKGVNGYELVKRVGVGSSNGEIVINGGFDSTENWTVTGGTSISGGTLKLIGDAGVPSNATQSKNTIAGRIYRYSISIISISGVVYLSFGSSIARFISPSDGTGLITGFFTAPTNATFIRLVKDLGIATSTEFDNLSIVEYNPTEGAATAGGEIVFGNGVHYTLATPVITPIPYAGLLNSNSNGTVYFEPAIKDIITYTDKAEISDTDYPISSIESIEKNGIAVNPATAVIAEGGLSLTHPDLEVNDEVELIYSYNKESTGRGMRLLFYNKA